MTRVSNQATPVSRALLPSAAQRWLDRALAQGLDLPVSVRIEQEGSIEIGGVRWPRSKRTMGRGPTFEGGLRPSSLSTPDGLSIGIGAIRISR
jgi:hypothetical protein